jgi:hypothetical protein
MLASELAVLMIGTLSSQRRSSIIALLTIAKSTTFLEELRKVHNHRSRRSCACPTPHSGSRRPRQNSSPQDRDRAKPRSCPRSTLASSSACSDAARENPFPLP